MDKRLFYPAVFHKAEEGGFWVTFPDIPECMTQGEDMQDAYEMAVDALGLSLTTIENEGEVVPEASSLDEIVVEDGVLVIVVFDMAEYRRKNRSRAVKKTLSIPEWLNEAAIRENLNFSQILQNALSECKIAKIRTNHNEVTAAEPPAAAYHTPCFLLIGTCAPVDRTAKWVLP